MLGEGLTERVFQLDDIGHRSIERAQMRQRGGAHGLLDQLGLAELLGAQPGQDPLDLAVEVAAPPGPRRDSSAPSCGTPP
jgi:hypothetical protein